MHYNDDVPLEKKEKIFKTLVGAVEKIGLSLLRGGYNEGPLELLIKSIATVVNKYEAEVKKEDTK